MRRNEHDHQRGTGSAHDSARAAWVEAWPAPLVVLVGEADQLRCLEWNLAATRVLGRDLASGRFVTGWTELDRDILPDLVTRARSSREAVVVELARSRDLVYRLRVVPLDEDAVAVELEDVSASKRAEWALAAVSDASRSLIGASSTAVLLGRFVRALCDRVGDVCAVHLLRNGALVCAAAADAGVSASASSSRPLYELFRIEGAEHGLGWVVRSGRSELVPEVDDALLTRVARGPAELEALRKLGTTSWLFVPLLRGNEVIGAVTVETLARRLDHADRLVVEELCRRLTEALEQVRHTESLARESALKDELLSVSSHDLRTPLSTIAGWTKLLTDDRNPSAERTQRGLEVISRNARAQAELIEGMLEGARALRRQVSLSLESVPLGSVLEEIVEDARPLASERGIRLAVEAESEVLVRADAARARRIVRSLLVVTIRATQRGGAVRARAKNEGERVALTIECDGPGIEPAILQRVFESAPDREAPKPSHAAVDLAVARELMMLQGGSLEASAGGLTARFQGAGSSEARPTRQPQHDPELGGIDVLLVDDHDDARELYASVLAMRGAHVALAASAAEAKARLSQSRFDVLVSDIAMPIEDGCSLVRHARKRDPGLRTIAISAFGGREDIARALGSGFERYLVKPLDTNELARAIAELVGSNPPPLPS